VTGAMQVLVVHAHPSRTSFSRSIADTAESTLKAAGHDVTVVHLDEEHFRPAMSAEERLAYDTATPILDAQVAVHADLVAAAEALVFIYPTWWAAPPAVLKGWMERVLVPGVAFTFEPGTHEVRAGLRHVRRLVGITTYGSSRLYVRILGDPGRRTIMRALRLLCARRCRRTWLGLYGMDTATSEARQAFLDRVAKRMARL
jgi:NAD(P)H dehydrogenase (quinone)